MDWMAYPESSVEEVAFADGTVWDRTALLARITNEGSADGDSLIGDDGDNVLQGLAGRDFLYGEGGNDTLVGGADDDQIDGGGGDDVIEGGSGADGLYGGEGNDTYLFSRGFGRDTLSDSAGEMNEVEVVRFQGIDPAQVVISRDEYHLYLSLDGTADVLSLDFWFDPFGTYRNKQVVFDDGTSWDADELERRMDSLHTSDGDDVGYGSEDSDTILALGGADILYGNGGGDLIDGGDGKDYLMGGTGIDLLRGGDGDDEIVDWDDGAVIDAGAGDDLVDLWNAPGLVAGGTGDDDIALGYGVTVVAFNRGDGNDTLFLDQNEAVLSLNVPADEIALRLDPDSSDLLVHAGQADSLRLVGWYAGPHAPLVLQLLGADGVKRYDLSAVIAQFDEEHPIEARHWRLHPWISKVVG